MVGAVARQGWRGCDQNSVILRSQRRPTINTIKHAFIYLSAGVSDEVFRETLELAAEAGTPFSGVLCGRATWQGGIPEYGRGGARALRAWLSERGVQNIQALNEVMSKGARPWWDFYGGREHRGHLISDFRFQIAD
jgi:tagatose 1,6-diphosphate aldolase